MGVKFYLFFNTLMNELIVSLPAEKLVFKIDISVSDSAAKIVPLVGNGQTCKGNGLCGDGNEAVNSSLTYPKVSSTFIFKLSLLSYLMWPSM